MEKKTICTGVALAAALSMLPVAAPVTQDAPAAPLQIHAAQVVPAKEPAGPYVKLVEQPAAADSSEEKEQIVFAQGEEWEEEREEWIEIPLSMLPAADDTSASVYEHAHDQEESVSDENEDLSKQIQQRIEAIAALDASVQILPDENKQILESNSFEMEQIATQIEQLSAQRDALIAQSQIIQESAPLTVQTADTNLPAEDESLPETEDMPSDSAQEEQPSEIPVQPLPDQPAAETNTNSIAQIDLQIAKLQARSEELAAQNAQIEASQTEQETEVSEPAIVPADNLHQLSAQLDEIERVYYLLHAGTLTGEKAEQILETNRAQFALCSKRADELARVNVYRLYNPNSGEHHYTLEENKRNFLSQNGWKDEGIGWKAPAKQEEAPVYRLYNPNSGDHHYTLQSSERDYLSKAGWVFEGISWYSDTAFEGLPIYRLYNPNAKTGTHHYTDSESENSALAAAGWKQEGVSWHGILPYSIFELTTKDGTGIVAFDDEDDHQIKGRLKIGGCQYYYNPNTGFRLTGEGTTPDPNDPGKTIRVFADEMGRLYTG